MTPTEFDVRAFWTVAEVLMMIPGDRRKIKDWLRAAKVVEKSAAGAWIVTRSSLEARMPEILETMRRSVTIGYGSIRQRTVTTR